MSQQPTARRASLSRRELFLTLLVIAASVLAVGLPIYVNWLDQTNAQTNQAHLAWDLDSRYSIEFWTHTNWASAYLNGTIAPWNNYTAGFVVSELDYSSTEIYNINALDHLHADLLNRIYNAILSLEKVTYVQNLNQTARTRLAAQLDTLGDDVQAAYSNFIQYGGDSPGIGPPFSYSGPSPPDESLLQDAANTATSLQIP